ncbi:hypothetical protein M405DRAFT_31161 [Rhizopogon salebrosus TDB-379]|nr:hypothetical protein M405DRAFT_31161 [Rhizopogon salebrosus TDB-379]
MKFTASSFLLAALVLRCSHNKPPASCEMIVSMTPMSIPPCTFPGALWIDRIPVYPSIMGPLGITSAASTLCGTCWETTYVTGGTTNSVYVLAVNSAPVEADAWVLSYDAFYSFQ